MPGPTNSRSRNGANSTGKTGNASGSKRREARGSKTTAGGKHPPARLFTSPQSERKSAARKRADYGRRQSNRG